MKNEIFVIGLIVMLAAFMCIAAGYDIGKRESKSEMTELKNRTQAS